MAIAFQFNKTSLNELNKQLKTRVTALPTIKSKESALRLEVRKAKESAQKLRESLDTIKVKYSEYSLLWSEFDASLIKLKGLGMKYSKIAGVLIPELETVSFEDIDINLYFNRAWFLDGINILKELADLQIRVQLLEDKVVLLDNARKKTTQKVNLYEKVQIPDYQAAILKIKRYLEDEDNLAKAGQKIIKRRTDALTT